MRASAIRAVARGEILYWEDVFDWLSAERAKDGDQELEAKSGRKVVRKMFEGIASASGSQSRVVSSEGAFGDGCQRLLCLFPVNARDEVTASLLLCARLANTFDGPSTPASATCIGYTSLEMVKRLLEEAKEADARMEIVCAAAEIVRADVDQRPDLKNARIRRQKTQVQRGVGRTRETSARCPI